MEGLAMKLSNDSMLTIKQAVTLIFGKDAKVYLFGSRADDAKKGGDIDLYKVRLINYSINFIL
jgi:predicted nucleotidyltransferase